VTTCRITRYAATLHEVHFCSTVLQQHKCIFKFYFIYLIILYSSTCLLDLRQSVEAVDSLNLLGLVFANFTDLKSLPANFGLVKPDSYHPPLNIHVSLPYVNKYLNCEFNYQNFAAGNYSLLYIKKPI
jgi:hypothetical protein